MVSKRKILNKKRISENYQKFFFFDVLNGTTHEVDIKTRKMYNKMVEGFVWKRL